jgi:hypothetical protein
MAIYFTLDKKPASALTVIFDADGLERARGYRQGLILDGAYRADQITITGTDSSGKVVSE